MTAVTAASAVLPRTRAGSARSAATALAVVCVGLCAATLALHAVNGSNAHTQWWVINGVVPLVTVLPGVVVARRLPPNPLGWLMLVDATAEGLCGAGREYGTLAFTGHPVPLAPWVGWACDSMYVVDVLLLPLLVVLLPTGRLGRGWTRRIIGALLAVGVSLMVVGMVGQGPEDGADDFFVFPAWRHVPLDALSHVYPLGFVYFAFALPLLTLLLVVLRYRSLRGEQRQQYKWVAWAGALVLVELAGESTVIPPGPAQVTGSFVSLLFLACAAIAVLRHRMLDIDVVINRTLVYALLTGAVVGTYVGVVALFDRVVDQPVRIGPGLVATAVVALSINPGRLLVQRGVDRLLYGERRNPYGAMAALGEQLGSSGPDDDLTAIVGSLTRLLRLPHAALRAEDGTVLAEVGVPAGAPVVQPLRHGGLVIGELAVSPRTGSRFAPDELRLLRDLAGQVAAALHAVRLTADLQASRTRLVTAKEEERRRLRNDLHDGLGPKLAALGLKLDAARMLVDDRPAESRALLDTVKHEIRSTIDDIRRLVYDLRPPTLDELGLLGAVRDLAVRLTAAGGPHVEVVVDGALPPLPAATEVAAFRIVGEALTNVVRHAGARTCRVVLRAADGVLAVRVEDDGVGLGADVRAGVGTLSMRERAAEIGGTLAVSGHPSGCRVAAELPLVAA